MPADHSGFLPDDDADDDVDLTNLVDPMVMLCGLLMILMPTVSNLQIRQAQLAETGGEPADVSVTELPRLEFMADGRMTWNDEPLTQPQLVVRLQQLPPKSKMLLGGDHRATYGQGLKIRSELQTHGIEVLELVKPANFKTDESQQPVQ